MKRHITIGARVLLGLSLLQGCSWDDPRVLSIDATGAVRGVAFLQIADEAYDPARHRPVPGVRVNLNRGSGEPIASDTTSATGVYEFLGLPVGTYELSIEPTSLADSLVALQSWQALTVAAGDTAISHSGLAPRTVEIAAARGAPVGSRLTVLGVALNAPAAFDDASIHIRDTSGTLRAFGVGAGVLAGDSVRVRGTIDSRYDQPALINTVVERLGGAELPLPQSLSSGRAAAAAAGTLDGALVRVTGATILDVASEGANTIFNIDDGSGALEVVIRRGAVPPNLSVGAILDATGVLLPDPLSSGRWRLGARDVADLSGRFLRVTTAEARELPLGRVVTIVGRALSASNPFGDGSFHIEDDRGFLRATRVTSKLVQAGYLVELTGTTGLDNGQRVLTNAAFNVVSLGSPPEPTLVSTADAAAAGRHGLDAAFVRITEATVVDTMTVAGEFQLQVDDASGPLLILLDRDASINTEPYLPGSLLDASGLLVPHSSDNWILKPRTTDDIHLRSAQ